MLPRPFRSADPTGAAPAFAPLDWRSPLILALLAIGALERVAWNVLRPAWSAGGEAFLVALALGEGRGFADAYGRGSGATAHLLPVSPGIAGLVYALFGYTPGAEVVLAGWSIGLALGSYLLLDRAFARLGVAPTPRLAAFAFLCLVPTYIAQEAVDFRVWEGGLAAFLAALMLGQLLAASAGDSARRRVWTLVALAPLLFFVQPILGIAAYLGLALLWAGKVHWRIFAGRFTASLALLALLVAPWAIRNMLVLGEPVLLRSNAGLELAIANYPGVPTHGDRHDAFMARLHAVHPLQGRAAYAAATAQGEVAYSRMLGRQASAWIAAHPGDALRGALAHIGDTITPGAWMFRIWGDARIAPAQALLASMAGVLGLAGLLAGLVLGRRGWRFVALFVGVPVLLFAPFQPVMRYTYLVYAPLVFCAACGLALLVQRRRPQAGS